MTTFADRLNPPIEPKPARFNRPEPWDYYRRTYIATPFAGASHVSPDVRRRYTLSALADSIGRKEAPIAPHLLYPLVLDDADPEQREIAMLMGRAHLEGCLTLAVYVDLGITAGMLAEIQEWESRLDRKAELRRLPDWRG